MQRQCASCGTWLKYTSHRPCPKPQVIQEYLKEHTCTGFEGQIQDCDRVCLTCYRSHLVCLQDPKPVSRDSDLRLLLSTYSKAIPSIDQVTNRQDVIKTAMAKTLVTVGKLLLDRQAILLPSIHNCFASSARDIIIAAKGLQEPQYLEFIRILSDLTASHCVQLQGVQVWYASVQTKHRPNPTSEWGNVEA